MRVLAPKFKATRRAGRSGFSFKCEGASTERSDTGAEDDDGGCGGRGSSTVRLCLSREEDDEPSSTDVSEVIELRLLKILEQLSGRILV